MGNTFFFEWEVSLMAWLQAHMGSFGTSVASFFTMFGEELLLIAILGFFYWCYDKKTGERIGTVLIAAVVWNPLIKNIVLRRRPYFDHQNIRCLRPVEKNADLYDITAQGYSFPSGHSSNAASAYGAVAYNMKKKFITAIAVVLVLLVGISRFMLGVHYPTDVLCGWLLGIVAVFFISFLQKKIRRTWVLYLLLAFTGLPGWFYCTSSDFYTSYGMMIGAFAAFLFEARFVHFENTKNPVRCILRLLGGIALFLGLNTALKLPFSTELLQGATLAARLIRTMRYAIVTFSVIGIYPMVFRLTAKIGQKNSDAAS